MRVRKVFAQIKHLTEVMKDDSSLQTYRFQQGRYSIGIDFASGKDQTVYVIAERPSEFERFLRKIHLSHATWEVRVKKTGVLPMN